jgi:hypothetical protein
VSVPDPRKRSPFEAPVILTSAPRSSFFSATLVQTRLAIPLHRPVLVTPQKRLIETTPASPPNPSQDPQIPDLASPRYQPFPFPHTLFLSPSPPSRPLYSMPSPPSSPPTTPPSTALAIRLTSRVHKHAEARAISYVFHAVSHASPRNAIHLPEAHSRRTCKFARACDPLTQRPRPRSDAISLRSDSDQLFFFALPAVAVAVNLVSFASV